MDHNFDFEVAPHKSITDFLLSEINFQRQTDAPKQPFRSGITTSPYEYEMDGIDNEYPGRAYFLKHLSIDSQELDKSIQYDKVYSGFEDTFITQSSDLPVPTLLKCWAHTYFSFSEAQTIPFKLSTPGGMKIWINGKLATTYKNYTRNTTKDQLVTLDFEKGSNEVVIYFDDLGERDVDFIFQMVNVSDQTIHGHLPLSFDASALSESRSTLASVYFLRDYFDQGEITFALDAAKDCDVRVRFNPLVNSPYTEMQTGDITEFKNDDRLIKVTPDQKTYRLGDVSEFQTASLSRIEFGIKLPNNTYVTRTIVLTIYNSAQYDKVITGATLEERKAEALDYYSKQPLDDVNIALSKLKLGLPLTYEDGHKMPFELESSLNLIDNHGDCADFVLVPLLMFAIAFPDKLPEKIATELKRIALDFRYWIDEPGNDVMWWFSENHALLFHISQYFAGYLYPDENFSVSDRSGAEQQQIGKDRIIKWFDEFFKYGLAEWNSMTYIPIDLIGFFSLQIAAPDQEIRATATKALDYLFDIMAISSHGENYASTYGRTYEHNLKNITLGEISSVMAVAYNIGNFNDALRDTVLFALSDYVPNEKLTQLFHPTEPLQIEYLQGQNKGHTYVYKTKDYMIASTVGYHAHQHGYQQHMMNIALKGMVNNIWINNPGEDKYSGDHRPSYWAGNNRLPEIAQHQNHLFMHYALTDVDLPFIHIYFPFWEFDEVKFDDHYLLYRKGNAAGLVYFSMPMTKTTLGPNTNREFIAKGTDHFVYATCFTVNGELPSLKDIEASYQIDADKQEVKFESTTFQLVAGQLVIDGQPVDHAASVGYFDPDAFEKTLK